MGEPEVVVAAGEHPGDEGAALALELAAAGGVQDDPGIPLGQQFPQPGVRRTQPSRITGHIGYIGHRPHFTTAGPP